MTAVFLGSLAMVQSNDFQVIYSGILCLEVSNFIQFEYCSLQIMCSKCRCERVCEGVCVCVFVFVCSFAFTGYFIVELLFYFFPDLGGCGYLFRVCIIIHV